MKNKLRILASVLFFFFTTQSSSSPINKINFIGLNNAPEESLLQLIPFKAGQEYTSDLSDGIIESLFETGLFSDITISNNENSLIQNEEQFNFILRVRTYWSEMSPNTKKQI